MAGWTFGTTSDYARSGSPPLTAQPLTWIICAVSTSLAATQCPGEITADNQSAQNFRFQLNTNGKISFTAAQGSSQTADTTNTVSANVPFIVCGRARSATDRDTVLDGDLANKGTNTTSRVPGGVNRISYGKKDDTADSNPFVGTIFYAALWNVALDDDEVVALAKGFDPRMIRPASLVGFWDTFDGSTGTIRDLLGTTALTVTGGTAGTGGLKRLPRSGPAQLNHATPPAGPSIGMPVLMGQGGAITDGTTGSFTPAANSILIAAVAGRRSTGSNINQPTISDTAGLTWTEIRDTPFDDGAAATRMRTFYAEVGPSPTSMTVTGVCSNAGHAAVVVVQTDGEVVDFSNCAYGTDSAGDPAVTFSSAPAADSAVLTFFAGVGNASLSVSGDYVEIYDEEPDNGSGLHMGAAYDLTTPGTGVTWTSTNSTSIAHAIELKLVEAYTPVTGVELEGAGGGNTDGTTASFTPPADSILIAFVGGRRTASAASPVAQPTISDSLGGTWNPITEISYSDGVDVGGGSQVWTRLRAFWRQVSSSPAAMTVTGVCSNAGHMGTVVVVTDGAATDFSSVATGSNANGDPAVTLGASPAGTSLVLTCAGGVGNALFAPDGDFTEIYDAEPDAGSGWHMAVAYDDTTPGTGVTWTSTNDGSVAISIEIKATGAGLHVGGGDLDVVVDLGGKGSKADAGGGGTLTATPAFGGRGTKADAGGGALTATAAVGGKGSKADAGGGALAATPGLGGKGGKAVAGGGALAATVELGGRGTKADAGGGALAATVELGGRGAKAAAGGGVLDATASLGGQGGRVAGGGGQLTATPSLGGQGSKADAGGGVLAVTPTFGGRGGKAAAGGGALAATVGLGGRGGKAAAGGGALAATVGLGGQGGKAGGGAAHVGGLAYPASVLRAGAENGTLAPLTTSGSSAANYATPDEHADGGNWAYALPTVNDYLIGSVGGLRTDMRISFRYKRPSLGVNSILGSYNSNATYFRLSEGASGNFSMSFLGTDAVTHTQGQQSANRLIAGVWNHIVISIEDGVAARMWLNGQLALTFDMTTFTAQPWTTMLWRGTGAFVDDIVISADPNDSSIDGLVVWDSLQVVSDEGGGKAAAGGGTAAPLVTLDGGGGKASAGGGGVLEPPATCGGTGTKGGAGDGQQDGDADTGGAGGGARQGSGALAVTVGLGGVGNAFTFGTGDLLVIPEIGGRGSKAGLGGGALAATVALEGVGARHELGGGDLSAEPTTGGKGGKAGVGGGDAVTIDVTPTVGTTGKAGTGGSSLALDIALGGRGVKAGRGGGALVASVELGGAGTRPARVGGGDLAAAVGLGGSGGKAAAGAADLAGVDDLGGAGTKAGGGQGDLAAAVELGGVGFIVLGGTGAIDLDPDLGGTGGKAAAGGGVVDAEAALGGAGSRMAVGTGDMPFVVDLSQIGSGARAGGGMLSVLVVFGGESRKAVAGTGELVAFVAFGGAGTPNPSTAYVQVLKVSAMVLAAANCDARVRATEDTGGTIDAVQIIG